MKLENLKKINAHFLITVAIVLCKLNSSEITNAEVISPQKVNYLEPGDIYTSKLVQYGSYSDNLKIYCYNGQNKTLKRLFESLELRLNIDGDDYTQYDGTTSDEVEKHYNAGRSLFSLTLFSQKRTRLQLSPFMSNCLGIDTTSSYQIELQRIRVDLWRVIQMACGCLMFNYARKLSQNSIFYYITGIVLGICSSFMLVIWLISKVFPRRPLMYGTLIGGWTVGIYLLQILWDNIQIVLVTYKVYVLWYIFVTGIISFFFCYRWGPPKNKRSRDIIKWLLQLISMALIYFSSHNEDATTAVIVVAVTTYYFPRSFWYKCRAMYLKRYPPKRRLLTLDEYDEQSVKETSRALDELRKFASSPECKQWKVMTKLRDPFRFAAFVEGESHLRDDEILRFESSKFVEGNTDNEESDNGENEDDPYGHIIHVNNSNRGNRHDFLSTNHIRTSEAPVRGVASQYSTLRNEIISNQNSSRRNYYD